MPPSSQIPSASPGRFLRPVRIAVSLGILAAATLFAVGGARLTVALGWVEKIQILPFALVSCLSTLGCWLVVTLVFGRLYCSTACPLGTLQDVISRIPRLSLSYRRNHPYHFAPAMNPLRYITLLIFCGFVWIGFYRIPELIAPREMFNRMADSFLSSAIDFLSPAIGCPGGESVGTTAVGFVTSLLTLGALGIAAWQRGRLFCNTLCPVGTGLSLFSRFSIYHFDIDTDRCTNCRRCEYVCKAQCINLDDHLVDGSRCVVCFDCIGSCPDNAIRYTRRRKQLSIPMLQRIPPLSAPAPSPLSRSSQPAPSPLSRSPRPSPSPFNSPSTPLTPDCAPSEARSLPPHDETIP